MIDGNAATAQAINAAPTYAGISFPANAGLATTTKHSVGHIATNAKSLPNFDPDNQSATTPHAATNPATINTAQPSLRVS
jgi:hypothetical protein